MIRIVYFLEYRALLEFLHPTVDALYHHTAAKAIAGGAWMSSEPFFRAPLYNYFLGFIYWLTSDSIAAARFLQLTIGALTAPLTFLVARQMFDRRVAAVAAILTLLTADIVYFEGELLLESSVLLLILGAIYLTLRYRQSGGWKTLALIGLLLGLAIIDRPNTVVLAPIVGWLLWKPVTRERAISRGSTLSIVAIALSLPVGIVLAHNLTRSEPALTIATQGGVNFYIGNNLDADGISAVMPGKLGYAWQYEDIRSLAELESARKLSPSEISGHYFRKGWAFIAGEPLAAVKLWVRKLYLIFSGEDISNNRNLPYFKEQIWLLRWLPVGMGILAPLGLIGMVLAYRRSSAAPAVAAFIIVYGLSFVAFFVNSRFRLPLLPLLAVFSAVALWDLIDSRRRAQRMLIIGGSLICLTVLLNANLYRLQFDNRQQAEFNRGNLLMTESRIGEAISAYRLANSLGEPLQQVNLNLGVAFMKLRQYDSAWQYFWREDSLMQGSAEALNNLAYLYRQTQQYDEAVIAAEAALAEKPYLEAARLNLWYALRESGRPDSAFTLIKSHVASQPLSLSEMFIFAAIETDLRDFESAERHLREILNRVRKNEAQSYSEASALPLTSDVLAPTVFESRVLYNLGYALAGRGFIDSAVVYFAQATTLDPDLVEAWINLGSAYLTLRKPGESIAALEQALAISEPTPLITFNLSLAHFALADTATALSYARQCLNQDSSFLPARQLLQTLGAPPSK